MCEYVFHDGGAIFLINISAVFAWHEAVLFGRLHPEQRLDVNKDKEKSI
jgi:hypothetical protein